MLKIKFFEVGRTYDPVTLDEIFECIGREYPNTVIFRSVNGSTYKTKTYFDYEGYEIAPFGYDFCLIAM